jgi:HlyD family secretion protein
MLRGSGRAAAGFSMTDLSTDLAALRIPSEDRGGRRGPGAIVAGIIALLLVVGAGVWFYTARLQAARVKVAAAAAPQAAGSTGAPAVLNASGYVTARRRATVSSKVTGKVLDVLVEEGHPVREGQVLAHLDDTQARAALNLADAQLASSRKAAAEDQARLKQAELTLVRLQQLVKENVVGKAELDSAQAEVDALRARIAYSQQQVGVAERQVDMQRANLNDMVVRAPFSGVAISKDAQPGEMISPVSAGGGFTRTGICTIVDMSSLEIEVDVNESYINRVRAGQKVEAVLDAYPDWTIPSHVITTIPSADRQKATVKVRIGFDPPVRAGSSRAGSQLDPRILPDMGVKVSFLRDEPAAGQPRTAVARAIVPKSAVRSIDGRAVVFVVAGDRVERRAVSVGEENGDRVEVLSGVSAGERVVVDGPQNLKDGDKVKVLS